MMTGREPSNAHSCFQLSRSRGTSDRYGAGTAACARTTAPVAADTTTCSSPALRALADVQLVAGDQRRGGRVQPARPDRLAGAALEAVAVAADRRRVDRVAGDDRRGEELAVDSRVHTRAPLVTR